MRTISESVYELLMAQGLARGTAATVGPRVNKGPALSTMASSGGVKAGAEGGLHRPIGPHAGGGKRDQLGNSERDRGNVTPAKFTGLRIVVDNSRCKPIHPHTRVAPRGIGFHLVLVK